jgi:hypothetical protein
VMERGRPAVACLHARMQGGAFRLRHEMTPAGAANRTVTVSRRTVEGDVP